MPGRRNISARSGSLRDDGELVVRSTVRTTTSEVLGTTFRVQLSLAVIVPETDADAGPTNLELPSLFSSNIGLGVLVRGDHVDTGSDGSDAASDRP